MRFEASIRRLAAAGYNAYLEVGPGAVLTGLVKRIDGSAATATAGDVGSLAGGARRRLDHHPRGGPMTTTIDLSGKIALVTGAGRGIGREIALTLAAAGAAVAVNDFAGEEACLAVVAEIEALGGRGVSCVMGDVGDEAERRRDGRPGRGRAGPARRSS